MPRLLRFRPSALLAAAALLLAGAAGAQAQDAEPTLKVGDDAPPLAGGDWVKGEPVTEFEEGKVYVMEMWATWCGPCIAAIPHVTELQHKYKDDGLIVIGQNVWENQPDNVKPFVDKMGDKMDYRVVMDSPSGQDGAMANTWMRAAGQNGIPCSFIINQEGKIAWIGHPMSMDEPLAKVIAGDYDIEAEAKKLAEFQKMEQAFMAAMQAGNTDKALAELDKIAEARPEMKAALMMTKFGVLSQDGKWDEAYEVADKAIDETDDAQMLNRLAWGIVDPNSPFAEKNLDVAMKASKKACDLTDNEDGMILDTLARVHYLQGDAAEAANVQAKAIEHTEEGPMRDEMIQALETYKSEAGA